jgi:hypothetical protein
MKKQKIPWLTTAIFVVFMLTDIFMSCLSVRKHSFAIEANPLIKDFSGMIYILIFNIIIAIAIYFLLIQCYNRKNSFGSFMIITYVVLVSAVRTWIIYQTVLWLKTPAITVTQAAKIAAEVQATNFFWVQAIIYCIVPSIILFAVYKILVLDYDIIQRE